MSEQKIAMQALPSRFVNLDAARRRFGAKVDRLGGYLSRVDPPADAAVAALASTKDRSRLIDTALSGRPTGVPALDEFVVELRRMPAWLDFARIDPAGQLLLRAGLIGGIVLGAKSLVYGYAAPAGNKPLVFSGQLVESAPRRLNETARFVGEVSRRGGMHLYAEGFLITAKVRLMHAQVRRMIAGSGRWNAEQWGAPINQHDMVATTLLFSLVTMDGLRQFGIQISDEEADAFMQLWRYVGFLMGVDEALLPTSEADARELAELIELTQGPPDADSIALVRALLLSGESSKSAAVVARAKRTRALGYGLCRALIGDTLADQLEVPKTAWSHALTATRPIVEQLERARRLVPGLRERLVRAGEDYWQMVVREGVYGATTDFRLPDQLASYLR